MNQQQTQIVLSTVQCLIQRLKSKSPSLFRKIQWIAGILAALCALMIGAMGAGFFDSMPTVQYQILLASLKAIVAGLAGCGLIAALPSTDPKLVSKELKDAILNQAVADGTHMLNKSSATDATNDGFV